MASVPNRKIGKSYHYFETINSTNDYAEELIANSNPIHGTVISAGFQYQGRGQFGRVWEGKYKENIYVTIILKPDKLPISRQFLLNKMVALCIAESLESISPIDITLKWPNDIYVGKRKLGGVLIKNIVQGKNILYAIVGIGLNINQLEFSQDLPNPTSLNLENNSEYDLGEIQELLFATIDRGYNNLFNDTPSEINEKYRLRLLGLNEEYVFSQGNNLLKGIIMNVDDYGRLGLNIQGKLVYYAHHEIKMIL